MVEECGGNFLGNFFDNKGFFLVLILIIIVAGLNPCGSNCGPYYR